MTVNDDIRVSDLAVGLTAAVFVTGLAILGVRLKQLQLDEAAKFGEAAAVQAERRVSVPAVRGRILDRFGRSLADNRPSLTLMLSPAAYQARREAMTVTNIIEVVERVKGLLPRMTVPEAETVSRHLRRRQSVAMPILRQLSEREAALFAEHSQDYPGITLEEDYERYYPYGSMAAQLIGFTSRHEARAASDQVKIHFRGYEQSGREGLERYYDDYLRGSSGEMLLKVDARGYTVGRSVEVPACAGPDLKLTLDVDIQRVAERELAEVCGACVAIDPRDGSVLAMVSAPSYNLNDCVPVLTRAVYSRLKEDRFKPLINRATAGGYAPGSTFKPLTALAALRAGVPANYHYECEGVYELSGFKLRCARRWGHGELGFVGALRESCNPFFCELAVDIGTNALCKLAREFGLGRSTGIDYLSDYAGVVPDGEWKERTYNLPWYSGDLAQMGVGQSMLLVTPLQMAMVVGALGTGRLAKPRLKADLPVEVRKIDLKEEYWEVVREGMRQVVERGSGKRIKAGLTMTACGKTGTAEVGQGSTRRKNTWFIAYAPAEKPEIAIALVVENGVAGGETAAPKVAAVLREYERKYAPTRRM